jgi:hypothetical protein
VVSGISGHYPAPAPGTQYGTELHNADVSGQKLSPSGNEVISSIDSEQTVHILVAIPFIYYLENVQESVSLCSIPFKPVCR